MELIAKTRKLPQYIKWFNCIAPNERLSPCLLIDMRDLVTETAAFLSGLKKLHTSCRCDSKRTYHCMAENFACFNFICLKKNYKVEYTTFIVLYIYTIPRIRNLQQVTRLASFLCEYLSASDLNNQMHWLLFCKYIYEYVYINIYRTITRS